MKHFTSSRDLRTSEDLLADLLVDDLLQPPPAAGPQITALANHVAASLNVVTQA